MATESEKKEEQPASEDKSSEKQPDLGDGKAEGTTDASQTNNAAAPKDGAGGKQGGEKAKDDEDVPQTFPQRVSGTWCSRTGTSRVLI